MKTKNGKTVTDAMLDAWADAFESGEWPKGRTVPVGRPSLANEEVRPITFRLPVSQLAALDAKVAKAGLNRSSGLRLAVEAYLAS